LDISLAVTDRIQGLLVKHAMLAVVSTAVKRPNQRRSSTPSTPTKGSVGPTGKIAGGKD
jgi:hypothetical protein